MERYRHYDFEGVRLDIPLRYDDRSGIFIEEYPDFTEQPVWTRDGSPVMFSGEDACPDGQTAAEDRCIDCGACRHYHPAEPHSWIGVCGLAKKKRQTFMEQLPEKEETP